MKNNHQITLGISLGTRTIGYAVLQNQELYDWGVKSFKEKWSDQKIQHILKAMERIIVEHEVTNASIKIPRQTETYKSIIELQNALSDIFKHHSINVYTSSLNNLKLWYSIDEKSPKSSLEEYVLAHYPVLCKKQYLSDAGHKYYMKLYEALAAAEMSQFLK